MIEPVLSTCLIHGDVIDATSTYDNYINRLKVIDNIFATTISTKPKDWNEIRGRWAGWIMWGAPIDSGFNDSICVNRDMYSTPFAVTLHCPCMSMNHSIYTSEKIKTVAGYAKNICPSLYINMTFSMTIFMKLTL